MTFKVFAQFQQMEEIEINFVSFTYTQAINQVGIFSVIMEADMLKFMIPGMDMRIEWRGEPMFSGRFGTLIDDTETTVTFNGKDEMGKLGDRLIDWAAANTTTPFLLEAVNATLALRQLFNTYTGKTSTDTDYNYITYVDATNTSKKWKFNNRTLADALIELANSSSVSVVDIGFSIWIDGRKRVRFNPLGSGTYHDNITYKVQSLSFDNTQVVNDVKFIGGVPPIVPGDKDFFTEDGTPGGTPTGWSLTYNPSSDAGIQLYDPEQDAPVVNTGGVREGNYAIRINIINDTPSINAYCNFSNQTGSFGFEGTSADWSDGEGDVCNSAVKRAKQYEDVDLGNLILDTITVSFRWSQDQHGEVGLTRNPVVDCAFPLFQVYINTNDGQEYLTNGNSPTANHIATKEIRTGDTFQIYPNKGWKRLVLYPVSSGSVSLKANDIEGIIFRMSGITYSMKAANCHLWIDNLSFQFHQINIVKRNTDSINKIGIRTKSFSNPDLKDWQTAHQTSRGILARLEKEVITGDVEVPFNPNIRLNDMINIIWKGKRFKLLVRAITVTSKEKMVMILGSENPDMLAILSAFRVMNVNTQTAGQGYKLNATFDQDTCFEFCQAQCEEVCQNDKNQTVTGILTTEGIVVKNPCLENCETYLEVETR
ncbi:hypothetical protein LCGC14_0267140 [marine sediment metagenome]|uniref:Uncharacterized protein n=1 Tax=marine sediment metagenome TaxID=412755 RepID=A0A0F9X4R0_9ZZZZ